jgi:UDP-3-O-acyl-N-acetylglucosamine deacetylase
MTLKPAGENHGIKFQRVDLKGKPILDAKVQNVCATPTLKGVFFPLSAIKHIIAFLKMHKEEIMKISAPGITEMNCLNIL